MAKVSKARRKTNSRIGKCSPLTVPSSGVPKDVKQKKKGPTALEKKQLKTYTCSVCMEYPHNAVLLLCSSYNKGCRPYMCATSHRYSNCLEQYKKAYSKVVPSEIAEPWLTPTDNLGLSFYSDCFGEKMEIPELLCPLCRGQVKGWTVVEPARRYFNTKRRACMKDKCSFIGSYKQLRKHVRAEHPCARPREVDPKLAEQWNRLEQERERDDVISTIQSSTPGAIVMGDYVIETNYRGIFGDYSVDDYLGDGILFEVDSDESLDSDDESGDEEDNAHYDGTPAASGHRDDYYESRLSSFRSRLLSRALEQGRNSRHRTRGRGR